MSQKPVSTRDKIFAGVMLAITIPVFLIGIFYANSNIHITAIALMIIFILNWTSRLWDQFQEDNPHPYERPYLITMWVLTAILTIMQIMTPPRDTWWIFALLVGSSWLNFGDMIWTIYLKKRYRWQQSYQLIYLIVVQVVYAIAAIIILFNDDLTFGAAATIFILYGVEQWRSSKG